MTDHDYMMQAIEAAASARLHASPNPWVGCVIVTVDGQVFVGATEAPGGRHAEVVAIADLDEARLKTLGDQHKVPMRYTDAKAMIRKEALDIVSIATPNHAR